MRKKILQIVDSPGWAIDRLAQSFVKYNPQFDWRQIYVHPRALEKGEVDLGPIIEAIKWADVISAHYWRTLSQLLAKVPELKDKKIILSHYNEKNLLSEDWKDVDLHIACTHYSEKKLREAGYKNVKYIPLSFDPEVFQWIESYPPEKPAVGYVGRIVAWKGLKEVAQVCRELGVPLKFMGKMDDNDYWNSIPEEDRDNIDFEFYDCDDNQRPEFYKKISVYAGFSREGRETGTLGFIDALASGVPVVTTPTGLAADIGKDRENMMVVPFDAYELKEAIKEVLENRELAEQLRQSGWQTIKNYTDRSMAIEYGRVLFDYLKEDEHPWVSVIIPATYERKKEVEQILKRLSEQTYKNIEALVVWDEKYKSSETFNFEQIDYPCVHLWTDKDDGYNLAMARNLGVIHSNGEILVFCDSRMLPDVNAIGLFVDKLLTFDHDEKVWLFGDKGGQKQTFVENFSAIRRELLIDAGMFNERINEYGGMSQELRSRFIKQGFELCYCDDVKAKQMCKSSFPTAKRQSIIKMKELLLRLKMAL